MKFLSLIASCTIFLAGCASHQITDPANAPIQNDSLSLTAAHGVVLQTTANPAIMQGYATAPDGGQIHYWEAGQGPTLLLLHQAGSSSEENAGLVKYMSDKFHLVSFDWPGHGMSDDPTRELLTEDYTESAIAVLDHLKIDKAHVFGNHGGALLAMDISWKHPDRVDRIILSGTSGVKDMDAVQEFSDNLGLDEMNQIDREGVSLNEAWGRFTKYMPNSEPGEVLRAYMNNVTVRVRPYDAHYGVLKFDRRPALKAIRDKRILLMQAENDPFVSDQEMLLDILSDAERTVITNAGVFMLFEAPRASAEAIVEFLEKD
ncbi:MAG: alpha/beta hydrolase [Pseudomonadota bacterium]